MPGCVYLYCTLAPAAVPPSPKLQANVSDSPSGSRDLEPSNVIASRTVPAYGPPAFATGGLFGLGCTTTVRSAVEESVPSLAVMRSTYVPAMLKRTMVVADAAFPKVTGAGPLIMSHDTVSIPLGSPSSFTAAASATSFIGSVIVRPGPATTVGG